MNSSSYRLIQNQRRIDTVMTNVLQIFALVCVTAASSISALAEKNYLNLASNKTCSSQESYDLGSRIIEGQTAGIGAFPYMVSLRRKLSNSHFCGGSIVNKKWVLTAAHCLADLKADEIQAVVGTNDLFSGGVVHDVSFIIYHAEYNDTEIMNDIGLVKVSEPIKFNEFVLPVTLANSGDVDVNNYSAIISGWGRNSKETEHLPNKMQYFETCLIDRQTCLNQIGVNIELKDKICTYTRYNQGVCNGDSGSPLMANRVQIGIASFVVYDCAVDFPDVYTSVYAFSDWIEATINNNTCSGATAMFLNNTIFLIIAALVTLLNGSNTFKLI